MSRTKQPGRRGSLDAADVVDVFVYVTVLNLAAEFFPAVIAESFLVSLLTALVLKVTLEVVVAMKSRIRSRGAAAETPWGKAAAAGLLWLTLVASKFIVLQVEELLFGDRISLGGFVSVTVLIIALLLSRAGVRRLLEPADTARTEMSL